MRLQKVIDIARKAQALQTALENAYRDSITDEIMIHDLPMTSKPRIAYNAINTLLNAIVRFE